MNELELLAIKTFDNHYFYSMNNTKKDAGLADFKTV